MTKVEPKSQTDRRLFQQKTCEIIIVKSFRSKRTLERFQLDFQKVDAAHFPELKCLRAAASPGTTPHSKSKILTTHLLRLLLARRILELIFCIFFTVKTRYVIDMEDVGPVSVFVEGDVEKMKVSFPPPN